MQISHELKCHPKNFSRIINRQKTFEVRLDDRNFQAGDELIIREYDPENGWPDHGGYGVFVCDITYIERQFQLEGYVTLGLGEEK